MTRPSNLTPLVDAELGDLVTLPDGSAHSVRARARLTTPIRGLGGFLVLGECQIVLTTPTVTGGPISVYLPGRLPETAAVTQIAEGAVRYWAPHLPAISGAMGELLWRLLGVAGLSDPVVVLYRNDEAIPFIRTSFAWPGDLSVTYLDRSDRNDVAVDRHAAAVRPREIQWSPAEELYESFVRSAGR
jgi:hypothetical protein